MSVILEGEKYNPVRRTIKHNNIFLVADEQGNILPGNILGHGLYLGDTRFLSKFEVIVNNSHPVVLSSSTETGYSSVIIGTNLRIPDNLEPTKHLTQETIQVKRDSIIRGAYFETITLANYNLFEVGLKLELLFDADFLDIFEVRNIESLKAGNPREISKKILENTLKFQYEDETGAFQVTEIVLNSDNNMNIQGNRVIFEIILPPSGKTEIKLKINLRSSALLHEKAAATDFMDAFNKNSKEDEEWNRTTTKFFTDNEDFSEMISRSHKDINMLITKAVYGEYIAAGIPWFTTLFGRDSLIVAQQVLMLTPNIAKLMLHTLAKFQGWKEDPWREEEPGKILHEIRFGELARSNKIPHTPYYGTIDATPLWLILLYDYFKWTNDADTLEKLWPNAHACLQWMNKYPMHNGFACYKKISEGGLANQSWKDSGDSYMHSDGRLAESPIAPVEVQGYFYSAKLKMAKLAVFMGEHELAVEIMNSVEQFRNDFHNAFWMEDKGFYALALDKNGEQLKVVSSNPGHLLETGILFPEYQKIVAKRLLKKDMFSGWGIRTLSYDSVSYNPMSYHNGSIWPHDNSLIVAGLARTDGGSDSVLKLTTAMFESARLMYYKRLPELFCGFTRYIERQDPPVSYPVACIPQAWAAGSVFLLIQSMLKIQPDAQNRKLSILNPQLPEWLNFIELQNLRVGDASVSIEFRKTTKGLVIDVFDKKGTLDIIIRK